MATKNDFQALRANPNPQSPDAQRKFRSLQRKHDKEIESLQSHMSGIVQNKSTALTNTQKMADSVAAELEEYKRSTERQMQEMEQKAKRMVEEAKHRCEASQRARTYRASDAADHAPARRPQGGFGGSPPDNPRAMQPAFAAEGHSFVALA
jgi:hypothetical protein